MEIRRILAAVCACALCVGAMGGCSKSEDKQGDKQTDSQGENSGGGKSGGVMRDLSASEYADEMGIGINLGNTFDAYWENKTNVTTGASTIGANTPQDYEKCWGAVETTRECIDGIKEAGFSTLRIPVYWGNMMEDDGKYEINSDYIARVAEVADWALEDGMYVVINIHHFDGYLIDNKPKEEVLEITGKLWTQIGEYFEGYSDYLVFEGFNEAVGSHREEDNFSEDEIYDYVNALNQTFVDSVRATGGNNEKRLLVASGYWTNIDNTTKPAFVMPTDSAKDKLMVSVHYIDNVMYWTNQIGGEQWKNYTESQCELLKTAFIDKGIPVFLGEQTAKYEAERIVEGAEISDSSELMKYEMSKALDYGFVPVLWDVNDNFYSRTECKIKSDSDAAAIGELVKKAAE